MNGPEPSLARLFDLSGRTAIVTGASGYLGRTIAKALAEAGAAVVATSRDITRAQKVIESFPTMGKHSHTAIELDHLNERLLMTGFRRAVAHTGGIDILVNNGHEGPPNDLTDVTRAQFEHHLANAFGYFQLARCVRDHAVAAGTSASIINVGSMYGVVGSYPDVYEDICTPSPVAYHALKGGIVQMTRHLAVYWARDEIRVNCLSPGPFPNPQTAPAGLVERLEKKCPMHRMGKPHELKGAVVFLASDASSYMTGQNLIIDGGWTAW